MMNLELTLQRDELDLDKCFGRLLADDGRKLCYTLEDAVRERPGQPVESWKIKGHTAIPTGRYRITLENSPRFGPDTLTVNAVPGFVGVRMHAGNTADDTEGCPLLGMAINPMGIVGGTSRPAVALVKTVVMQALAEGRQVWMTVRNP